MDIPDLPDPLYPHLVGYTSDGENLKTGSCADVFHFVHPTKQGLFLKIRDLGIAPNECTLGAEKAAMSWLKGKLSVPRIVCFHNERDTEYLLMTQVHGVSGVHEESLNNGANLMREFALGMREIHSLGFESCPLDWRLENLLVWAQDLIETLTEAEIPNRKTRNSLKLELQELRDRQPCQEDLVFTHGDYCLPNILLRDGRLSGFVDWGYAGVGDRYLDIVEARNTIHQNLGADWVPLFLQEYGLQELDKEKMDYYQRVFDLFEVA